MSRALLLALLIVAVSGSALAPTQPIVARNLERPDGAHTVTVAAIARAGNNAALGRLVDNTPPETEITAGPSGTIWQPTATFAFGGADNLTPAPALRFSWRLDGGPWSAFASETTVTVAGLTAGSHLFEVVARDQAGNEDSTPAARSFTLSPTATVLVTIDEPAAGSVVAVGALVVQGGLSGAASHPAISVNGVAALVHGSRWAAEIPIVPGDNVITARMTLESGAAIATSLGVIGRAAPGTP